MNKAFTNFIWENFPSVNTPINATNLNKINNALDTIDDRVVAMDSDKANTDALSDKIETLGSAALYAHAENKFFLCSDGKVYKATSTIAVGDIITVGTNCSLDNIIDNLSGSGGGSSGVTSFNSRTGAVTPNSHDYTAAQVDYDNTSSGLDATTTQTAIDEIVTDIVQALTASY